MRRDREAEAEAAVSGAATQEACAARGHQPWVIATRTEAVDVWATQTRRVRYCTGCGMDRPSRRPAKPVASPS